MVRVDVRDFWLFFHPKWNETPAIYSLERAEKLGGSMNDCSFGPRAWKRIKKELSEKDKRPM